MCEFKEKKITKFITKKAKFINQVYNNKANKNNNKNYGHIVRNKQSCASELTFTKTVRIIQNNMFY